MISGKNPEKASIKQRIRDDMQNRTEEEVLEEYQNTDRISRDQMWIRFPVFRKTFDEINGNTGNKGHIHRIVSWPDRHTGDFYLSTNVRL